MDSLSRETNAHNKYYKVKDKASRNAIIDLQFMFLLLLRVLMRHYFMRIKIPAPSCHWFLPQHTAVTGWEISLLCWLSSPRPC